jgi:hypothetical protein
MSGGTLTLVNSIVTGNSDPTDWQSNLSQGGGIYFGGTLLTITDSTVSGNQANDGGGIYVDYGGSVSMTNSTVRENNASWGSGGGLYLAEGMATLTNCTVSQNRSEKIDGNDGGAIFVGGFGTLTLINSTITNNQVFYPYFEKTGGIANDNGTVNARNSIIAGNTTGVDRVPTDFHGTLTSQGYNFIGTDWGMTIVGDTTGNIVGTERNSQGGPIPVDARLGPLANNGGPTKTHALLTGSPAINAGNTATSPATDQRGFGRNGTAEMGAFEVDGSAPVVPVMNAVSRKTHGSAGTFDLDLPLTGGVAVESRSGGAKGNHTIVVTFGNTLASVGSVVVTSGSGLVSSSQIGSDAHQCVIDLSAIGNAQRLTVTLNDVTDSFGYRSSAIPVTFGILVGDTTGNGSVSASDIGQTKAESGRPVSAGNFLIDVNVSGAINASDIGLVKAQSGAQLP